jgi:hypothetical protein
MKKLLLSISALAVMSFSSYAQSGYHYVKSVGTGSEYSMNPTSGTTTIINATTPTSNNISSIQAIPFVWRYFGSIVQTFKVSTSGYLTFNSAQTTDIATNIALPSTSAPTNAIFAFWDSTVMNQVVQGTNTFPSDIRHFTYGTAPNRVFVVQWRLVLKGAATSPTNVTYYAIRFYEAGNGDKFDIVHNYGFGTFDATVGCQNSDGTNATQLAESPNKNFGGNDGSYDAAESDVYTFFYRANQPSFDMSALSCTTQEYVQKATNYNLTGALGNFGRTAITSFTLNYSIDGGAAVTQNITGVNLVAKGGQYTYMHNTPINFATVGTKTVKIWASALNGSNADGDMTNDTFTKSFVVLDEIAPRKTLYEVFTSSTCPPCLPGNQVLDNVLVNNKNEYTVIKYQYNFPGAGDPYYTTEAQARGTYYGGINSVPRMQIDGQWNSNPNSFTQALHNQYNNMPAFVIINATQTVNAAAKSIAVNISVRPLVALTKTYTLRTAIVERRTTQNIKNNGETQFKWVMKRLLPSVGGEILTLNNTNITQTFTHDFTFPGNFRLPNSAQDPINLSTEHSVEEFDDLIGVVFVQDDQTKEVLQSEWSSVAPISGVREQELKELGATIYPNPAKANFNIKLETSSTGVVTIFDLSGKVVMTKEISGIENNIDCSTLKNGLYMVEIVVDGQKAVKKLNIVQ